MSIIYFWGKDITDKTFTKQTSDHFKITRVSCGTEHIVIKTKDKLYVAGNNDKGQLGLVKRSFENVELKVLDLIRSGLHPQTSIQSVSCGGQHTLLLTDEGEVYSCGQGKQGALGYGNGQNSYSFVKVMKGVIKISAGADHSLALSRTKVYGWGNSKDGQLGLMSKRIYYTAKELNVYPCSYIFGGFKCSFFITSKGVFATGLNHHAQLGLGHQNTVLTPKRLSIQEQIIKIVGANYTIAITQNNQGILWGTGCFGQFLYPTKLQFLSDVQDATIQNGFGIVRCCEGRMFVWGSNSHGEIAVNDKSEKEYVEENPILTKLKIDGFATGADFSIGWRNFANNSSFDEVSKITRTHYHQHHSNYKRQSSNENMQISQQKAHSFDESNQIKESKMKVSRKVSNPPIKITQAQQIFKDTSGKGTLSPHKRFQPDPAICIDMGNSLQRVQQQVQTKVLDNHLTGTENHQILSLKLQNQRLLWQNEQLRSNAQNIYQQHKVLAIVQENNELKKQIKQKQYYFSKIKGEYLNILEIIENDKIFSRMSNLQASDFVDAKKVKLNKIPTFQDRSSEKIDQFGQRLTYLKEIIQSANKN